MNEIKVTDYDRQISVMTRSIFLAIKYGSQAMMVTSDEKPVGDGSIVVTSSCAAFLGAYADLGYSEHLRSTSQLALDISQPMILT